jgi:hypothetical protein
LVEGDRARDLGNEDHALVELDVVQDVDELAVLLVLGELAGVLLEALEGELLLIVDEDVLRLKS